jgi:hypothetical protein
VDAPHPQIAELARRRAAAAERGDRAEASTLGAGMRGLKERLSLLPFSYDNT